MESFLDQAHALALTATVAVIIIYAYLVLAGRY